MFKRISSLLIGLALTASAIAQQAIWGVPTMTSPEIHPDNTVTFRLLSPNAQKVELTGDFLPTQKVDTPYGQYDAPGVVELTKGDNGIWSYTTSTALSPELYSYSFIVDGMKTTDPSNVYLIRDTATLTNVFIIDGPESDLYQVRDVPHGTVSRCWYNSQSLGMARRLTIYTPAGYEQSSERYPVFYLLHGMGGDEEAWPSLGRATQILDNLIAQGKARPMIVVMTNGNAALASAPGESPAGLVPPTTQLPKTMDGSFEASFPEIVNYIDSNYRTIAQKSGRAIAGLSMGGFHSLHISKQYPDMFDYIGLFSAAIMPREGASSPIYDDLDAKLAAQFAGQPALYWIAIGSTDFLYDANVKYRALLDSKGYPYTYRESDGGHIWKNWRIYLSEFAPMLFRR